jgi:hypothetical protein
MIIYYKLNGNEDCHEECFLIIGFTRYWCSFMGFFGLCYLTVSWITHS